MILIVGCRSVNQAAEALNAKEHVDKLTIIPLDLMKLDSVRAFAEQVCYSTLFMNLTYCTS